jgi:hypothetical protein
MIGERHKYVHAGQTIYEWEQDMSDINIFFKPPPWSLKKYEAENKKKFGESFVTAKINVTITKSR